mmetsp:Transcript_102925/g.286633  ORF Transcript_102925/g.286633 Transcript_102925/m.286633 type:complete len:180 (+) Transcript_102925:48-587(+)
MVGAVRGGTVLACAFGNEDANRVAVPFDANPPKDPTDRVEVARTLMENLSNTLKTVREAASHLAKAGSEFREQGERLDDMSRYIELARASSSGMEEDLRQVQDVVKELSEPRSASIVQLAILLHLPFRLVSVVQQLLMSSRHTDKIANDIVRCPGIAPVGVSGRHHGQGLNDHRLATFL